MTRDPRQTLTPTAVQHALLRAVGRGCKVRTFIDGHGLRRAELRGPDGRPVSPAPRRNVVEVCIRRGWLTASGDACGDPLFVLSRAGEEAGGSGPKR